jgi:hypothetical protein
VPAVFEAFFVNVAPAPMAVPAAVRFVMASPSGSDALTVNVRSAFSEVEAVAGAVTTGARSSPTVMNVVAVPESALAAVNVTLNVPSCALVGVQLNVPDVFDAFVVKEPPAVIAVPEAVNVVIGSPFGSIAVTGKVIRAFAAPETVAGAVTTGALLSEGLTKIAVVAGPESAFDAVKVTL